MTVVVEYDADPRNYDTFDPVDAAAIDQRNLRDDPSVLFSVLELGEMKATVEPVA